MVEARRAAKRVNRSATENDTHLHLVRVRKPRERLIEVMAVDAMDYIEVWCICAVTKNTDTSKFPGLREALKSGEKIM